jgi:ribonuclease HI
MSGRHQQNLGSNPTQTESKNSNVQVRTGIQYIINSTLLFTREHIKAGGKIGLVADYVCKSTIERVAHCSPASLSKSYLPNNLFTEEELSDFAKRVKTFGSSSKRSEEQARAAASFIENTVSKLPQDSLQVWTDGSKLGKGSSGPTGAGAYILNTGGGSPALQLRYFLGDSTNQAAEIWAIGGALATIGEEPSAKFSEIHIFTDSDFTLKCLKGLYNSKVHHLLIKQVKLLLASFPKNVTHLHHVAGHAGIRGNEIADKLANDGARFSERSLVKFDLPCISKNYGFNHQLIRDEFYEDVT